ncbi:hypothetical protein HS088_TW11G00594 [Tripterygium wilfordii]|uniref:Uncharacterized protein n=1 Tax=Tripterygium wilfordii TaxID=458696 RepID=A0A7J7D2H5_TRIWF|nr:uncharacterized protein LOC120009758 isoform X1 [Tripterygium wilfordii]KAF5740523.1 hypothetical protein HS088_TW11G00594 [Tripterygium wilfordii]
MASSKSTAFLALLLVLLAVIAVGDDVLSDFNEMVCEEVNCGKGRCKAGIGYAFNYICKCDRGWKRTEDDDVNDAAPFLPCVIPNCSLDYSCQPAPPPVPETQVPLNISFFDPCYWAYCGEGSCTRAETYTFECSCKSGFYNLLDTSYFPCYSDCTIGSDCSRLGIKVANQKTTTNGQTRSPATIIRPGNFHQMIMLIMSMALALRK